MRSLIRRRRQAPLREQWLFMTVFWGLFMAAASYWLLGDGHAWWADLAYWMFVSVITWGVVFGWQARRRAQGADEGADTPPKPLNRAD